MRFQEMSALPPSLTIFLDANAIHNIASYLIIAERFQLPPYEPKNGLTEVRTELRNHLPQELADKLVNGLRSLSYLQSRSEQNDARIYTSRLAIAELWYGRLDGQAHIRMALEGIPYRQRQRQADISSLVMARLTQGDYDQVDHELSDILQNFYNRFGLELSFVDDNSTPSLRDVYILALEIQKRTFLDVIDCALFANSLAILANEFITSDGYLFDVIHKLKTLSNIDDESEEAMWRNVQQAIVNQLRTLHLNNHLTEADICFPRKPKSLGDDISSLHLL